MSQDVESTQEIENLDGRVLTFAVTGDPQGMPVFLLHGTPGSRKGPKPRSTVLFRQGVRLISYDRPGYGGSSRHESRKVADAAADVKAIAQHMGLERFAVVGRSGGAPHALACAALLPEMVVHTVALASVAPANASGLDWYQGMAEENVDNYSTVDTDAEMLTERLRIHADRTRRNPDFHMNTLAKQMTEIDLRVVSDVGIRRHLTTTYAEGLRKGPYGWIDDVLALRHDWGFHLDQIKGPVHLWHGADDNFSPVSHTRWLAENIPDAKMEIQVDTAHFGALQILPRILSWLTAWHGEMSAAGAHS